MRKHFFVVRVWILVFSLAQAAYVFGESNNCKLPFRQFVDEVLSVRAAPVVNGVAHGASLFPQVLSFMEDGTGMRVPRDGRTAAIPKNLMSPLIDAFVREYSDGAIESGRRNLTPAPLSIATGNKGHMGDHLDLLDRYSGEYQKHLGIDPDSLKLAVVAHDIGKAFLNEFIDAYVKARTDGNQDAFIHRYVMAHELHSIANIPKVVESVLRSQGINSASERGKKLLYGISAQIIEMIRLHNGVHVSANLEEMKRRYPGLDEKEIAQVIHSWWAENYRKFAALMSTENEPINPEYGGKNGAIPAVGSGAIQAVLNLHDRATITSPSAPRKLGPQNFGRLGFTTDLIAASLERTAKGNEPLIRAQAMQLKPYLIHGDMDVFNLAPVREAQAFNDRTIELSRHLMEMNRPELLREAIAGISEAQLPISSAQRDYLINQEKDRIRASGENPIDPKAFEKMANANVPQYLYYKVNEQLWHRVDGHSAENAITERYENGQWVAVRSGGHPMDHLMDLVVQNGRWPK
jgi:hypothetical protein